MSRALSIVTTVVLILVLSSIVVMVFFWTPWIPQGPRSVQPLESIAGVRYPVDSGRMQIYEHLAHADIALDQPVFGRELILTITFIPHQVEELALGIRENSFWLSYPWQTFYTRTDASEETTPQTATITVPLTDKLADRDQSLDLMIRALPAGAAPSIDDRTNDPTWWEAGSVTAEVRRTRLHPTRVRDVLQIADYIASLISRERVL